MAKTRRCAETNSKGKPCGMPPQEGSEFCWSHDPKKKKERTAARKLGGKHRKRPKVSKAIPGVDPTTAEGRRDLLKALAADVQALDNGVSRARALATIIREGREEERTAELEERLHALEDLLRGYGAEV